MFLCKQTEKLHANLDSQVVFSIIGFGGLGRGRNRNLIIKRKLRKQRHQQRLQQRLHLRFSQAGKQIEESSSTQAFTHMRGPIACGQML